MDLGLKDRVAIVAFNSSEDGPRSLATVEVLSGLTDGREKVITA